MKKTSNLKKLYLDTIQIQIVMVSRKSIWCLLREGSATIHFERCSADRRRIIEPHRCVARPRPARPAPRGSLALALFLENFFFPLYSLFSKRKVPLHWASHAAAFSKEQIIYNFVRQMDSSLSYHITLAGLLGCSFWKDM